MRPTDLLTIAAGNSTAVRRIVHAALCLLMLAGLGGGCAPHAQDSPMLDVFIPPHPPVIKPLKVPPVIVVLVPSAKDRMVEYRLNPDFETFFVNELVPVIDARFRTLPAPEHRGIGGISAGATAALSLSINHPEVFSP